MKYLFLALLITCSSAFAMQNNTFGKEEKVIIASALAGQVIGHGIFGASVLFAPVPTTLAALLTPILVPAAASTAISLAAYGTYKSGEYLYNRYTASASSQQS